MPEIYDPELVMRARAFAVASHASQMYGTRPYIEHLDATVSALIKLHVPSLVLAAGYLHDVLEDCPSVSVAEIQTEFSAEIAKIAYDCTGLGNSRHERMLDKASKIALNRSAAKVALCDRWCNMKQCVADNNHSLLARYAKELPLFLPAFLEANNRMTLECMAWAVAVAPELSEKYALTS